MRKLICHLLFTVAVLTVCSCGVESISDESSLSEAESMSVDDLASDLTCGYNVVIFKQDSLDNSFIPLRKDANVEIIYPNNPYFEFVKSTSEGQPCLRLALTGNKSDNIIQEKVIIHDVNTGAEKSVMVILHPSLSDVTSRATTEITAAENRCLLHLGRITHPLASNLNAATDEVFDQGLLTKMFITNNTNFFYNTANVITRCTLRESTSRNSQAKTTANSWGMDLSLPIKSVVIGFSTEGSVSHEKISEESREFLYLSKKSNAASMRIKDLDVKKADGSNDSISIFLALMNSNINDILNNPGSKNYNRYPLTPEGTYKMISSLGGYLFNSAVILGGEAVQLASKRNTMSRERWSHCIQVAQRLEPKAKQLKLTDDEKLALEEYKNLNDVGAELIRNYKKDKWQESVHFKNEEDEVKELANSELEVKTKLCGGNASSLSSDNVKEWVVGNDPANWVPICYANEEYYENFIQGNNDAGLVNTEIHSLLELCLDSIDGKPNPRYQLLKEAITPDSIGIIPYYASRNYYKPMQTQRLVIVDAFCKPMPKNDQSWPINATDPMGKQHLYYPLVANGYMDKISINWRDKVFPINADEFTGSDWKEGAEPVVLWVALDWANTTVGQRNGIIDIWVDKWGKESSIDGVYRRGSHLDYKVKAEAKDGSNYLYVKYANDDTPLDSLITGVCIYACDWDTDNDSAYRGKALAASPGTEFLRDYTSAANKKYYNEYWGADADWFRGENQKVHGHTDLTSLVDQEKKKRKHTAQIGYTKKRIKRDIMDTHIGIDDKKIDISVLGNLPRTNNNILTVLNNW